MAPSRAPVATMPAMPDPPYRRPAVPSPACAPCPRLTAHSPYRSSPTISAPPRPSPSYHASASASVAAAEKDGTRGARRPPLCKRPLRSSASHIAGSPGDPKFAMSVRDESPRRARHRGGRCRFPLNFIGLPRDGRWPACNALRLAYTYQNGAGVLRDDTIVADSDYIHAMQRSCVVCAAVFRWAPCMGACSRCSCGERVSLGVPNPTSSLSWPMIIQWSVPLTYPNRSGGRRSMAQLRCCRLRQIMMHRALSFVDVSHI